MSDRTQSAKIIDLAQNLGARRTPRRVYRRPMGILVRGQYAVMEGRSLSEGGVSFLLQATGKPAQMNPDDIPAGSRLTVSLILPTGTAVVLRGKVVYHNADKSGKSVGVKFDEVPLQLRREIRNYVSSKQVGEAELGEFN